MQILPQKRIGSFLSHPSGVSNGKFDMKFDMLSVTEETTQMKTFRLCGLSQLKKEERQIWKSDPCVVTCSQVTRGPPWWPGLRVPGVGPWLDFSATGQSPASTDAQKSTPGPVLVHLLLLYKSNKLPLKSAMCLPTLLWLGLHPSLLEWYRQQVGKQTM